MFRNVKGFVAFLQAMAGKNGVEGFRGIIENAEQEVMQLGQLAQAGAYAVERLNTSPPNAGVNVTMRDMPMKKKVAFLPKMMGVINTIALCGQYMNEKHSPTKSQAGEDVWQKVASLARQNGAVEVGFARINEHDIFKDFAIPYRNAVVFTIDMKKEAMNTAPSFDALTEVLLTYGALGQLALVLTDFLREEGYGAYPGFPIGGLVDYVRVAQDAGIGAIGYHGMLISPTEGTRQRINVVFTDMEIPEPKANPHLWLLDFCAKCQKCVRSCPPQAIYTTAEVNPVTGRKKTVHYEKCVDYFGKNQSCGVCVKVCPFSQVGYEKIQRGFFRAQAKVAASKDVDVSGHLLKPDTPGRQQYIDKVVT